MKVAGYILISNWNIPSSLHVKEPGIASEINNKTLSFMEVNSLCMLFLYESS